ncbi:MAG: HD domain-containing protein [Gammaproteobacteria bacterium]|nr:HD domain-containing protein [Gammaproteobacteria bacterium]
MANEIPLELDSETIADFLDSVDEESKVIATAIAVLEDHPQHEKSIHQLFRALHTIKGNANMCQLNLLTQFAHAIEGLFSEVRSHRFPFTNPLGEVILLAVDEFGHCSRETFSENAVDQELVTRLITCLEQLRGTAVEVLPAQLEKAIGLFRCEISGGSFDMSADANVPLVSADTDEPNEAADEQLAMYCNLAMQLEEKYSLWQGRTERSVSIAQAINGLAHSVEEPLQLQMAVYVHDLGMAFIADHVVLKEEEYSRQEQAQVNSHPRLSADLLRCAPQWTDAMAMVEQHHERFDGSGYPNGLAGNEIRPGARILAIVDAYESMIQSRPDRQYKRSLLRAASEINNYSGSQFCPEMVALFNRAIREVWRRSGE